MPQTTDSFLDYVTSPYVLRALAGVALIAVNAGVSGAFAAFRRSTFLISGASHAALAGAALVIVLETHGLIVGLDPLVGAAFAAVALGLLAAWASNRGSDELVETAIGVGFAFSMALAALLMSVIPEAATRVWSVLLGDVLLLTNGDLCRMTGVTLAVCCVMWWFRRPLLFVTFDIEGAKSFGIRAGLHNTLLFGLIALSCAVVLKSVGAIVVYAMLVAPAATALLLCGSVKQAMLTATAIAMVSGLAAIGLSYSFGRLSVGALAALLSCLTYFAALCWRATARRRGGVA